MKQQEVFKAMADPTRRAILKRLQRGALTAGEIGESFDMTSPSLSHHFAVLKRADLVRTERRGQFIVYSLNSTVVEDLARTLEASKIDDEIAFLLSRDDVSTPFARALPVIEAMPWHEKRLKKRLRELDAGAVDIRRRGLAGDVDQGGAFGGRHGSSAAQYEVRYSTSILGETRMSPGPP